MQERSQIEGHLQMPLNPNTIPRPLKYSAFTSLAFATYVIIFTLCQKDGYRYFYIQKAAAIYVQYTYYVLTTTLPTRHDFETLPEPT